MKKIRSTKGITLIALVITIIVLLILASVSIAMLTGDNGILAKAKRAKIEGEKAEITEQIKVAVLASRINSHNVEIDKEMLHKELSKIEDITGLPTLPTNPGDALYDFPLGFKVKEYKCTITETGDVQVNEEGNSGGTEQDPPTTYQVSKSGEGVTYTNDAETVEQGTAYNTTITATEGKIIDTVSVTMNGTEVTPTIAEDKKTATISIENVSGDIAITVTTSATPTLLSLVNGNNKANQKDYYGRKVTGYTANGVSDWRIFYADDSNVFIRTTDYLENSKVSIAGSGKTMTTNGTYSVYWGTVPTSADSIDQTLVDKFSPVIAGETVKWDKGYTTKSNAKCVSYLLNKSNWSAFANDMADPNVGAIGSPTLNMYVASWNTKYPSDKIYCNATNDNGYKIASTSSGTTTYVDYSSKTGYKDIAEAENMYYPHKSRVGEEGCQGYFLASPAASVGDVCSVLHDGYVGDAFSDAVNVSVCPVVCLSSDIKAVDDGTTITLSK